MLDELVGVAAQQDMGFQISYGNGNRFIASVRVVEISFSVVTRANTLNGLFHFLVKDAAKSLAALRNG